MIGINETQAAKILLVEDEPDMAQLVRNWLLHQKHTIITSVYRLGYRFDPPA